MQTVDQQQYPYLVCEANDQRDLPNASINAMAKVGLWSEYKEACID